MNLLGVRLPIDWPALGFTDPADLGGTTVTEGSVAWQWDAPAPGIGIEEFSGAEGSAVPGWGVDHVVLLVPEIDEAVDALVAAAVDLRLRTEVKGRRTAFFRAGPVVEMIEENVRQIRLYGIALVTEEPLDEVATRWSDAGYDVGAPHDAIQKGRRIFSVSGAGAGLAVLDMRRET